MKKGISCFFLVVLGVNMYAQLKISSALCENKIDPIGISVSDIHFGWELTSKENGQLQTAYQLVISSSLSKLQRDNYDVWNSSQVTAGESIRVIYKGKKLQPATTYYWRVKVWDKKNTPSGWSQAQHFVTGIFTKDDWNGAQWIGYEALPDSMRVVPGVHAPLVKDLGNKCQLRPVVPLFRKQFRVQKAIGKALLFVTGLGQYEVNINGSKVGHSFLSPGWTHYDKTVLYNVYDVTEQLARGQNVIGAVVGNGFYNINRERYFKIVTAFGMPQMICRLKIIHEDGTEENIISDKSWKTSPSAITFTSIYGGEDYDARLEQVGWDQTSFTDTNWKTALLVKAPAGKLMPEQDYPVMLMDSFAVKKVQENAPGVYLYDFGQNISGILRLKMQGKKGQTIKLVPAELIKNGRTPNQDASGGPFYFSYTIKGEADETWQPQFTYYGFRYVEVEGAVTDTTHNNAGLPVIKQLTSLHNRNSNPQNGSFECSNDLFNRIYTLINWAIKSNMQSVITDCPHREKLSWLEQDYLMGASVHYNYDIYHLYRKLVLDLIDAQYAKGFVPDIAPELVVFEGGFLDSPEWGSASVILPWLLYTWYGDKDILQRAYPMMKKYVAYLESRSDGHLLSHGLGDWFDYGPGQPGEAQLTPKAVTATSIYYYDLVLLGKMASALNFTNEASIYQRQSLAVKRSFNEKFFNTFSKVYSTGSQTAMSMPLCVGLVDEQYKKEVLKNLVDSIYATGKALTAGDIGFHFLIKALDDGGASQLIYDMNNRDDVPGYGFQLKKGATALTESWPALEIVSNNHLMLGHLMEWFYSGLAGISQEEGSVGYKHIKIRPQAVGDIRSAKGSFHSPYGWITTEWKTAGKSFYLHVQVPVNATATVYLPASASSAIVVNGQLMSAGKKKYRDGISVVQIGSGGYDFEVK